MGGGGVRSHGRPTPRLREAIMEQAYWLSRESDSDILLPSIYIARPEAGSQGH